MANLIGSGPQQCPTNQMLGDAAFMSAAQVRSMPIVTVTTTTVAAAPNTHYILTNVSATTLTLPGNPQTADTVTITVANNLLTNVIARNGSTIMGLAQDMTLDNVNATVTLRYLASTWRII